MTGRISAIPNSDFRPILPYAIRNSTIRYATLSSLVCFRQRTNCNVASTRPVFAKKEVITGSLGLQLVQLVATWNSGSIVRARVPAVNDRLQCKQTALRMRK